MLGVSAKSLAESAASAFEFPQLRTPQVHVESCG